MSIAENGEITHRSPGRPPVRSDGETLRVILDAASQEFHAAMLVQAKLPDAAQIADRAKACARLFLNGCRA